MRAAAAQHITMISFAHWDLLSCNGLGAADLPLLVCKCRLKATRLGEQLRQIGFLQSTVNMCRILSFLFAPDGNTKHIAGTLSASKNPDLFMQIA